MWLLACFKLIYLSPSERCRSGVASVTVRRTRSRAPVTTQFARVGCDPSGLFKYLRRGSTVYEVNFNRTYIVILRDSISWFLIFSFFPISFSFCFAVSGTLSQLCSLCTFYRTPSAPISLCISVSCVMRTISVRSGWWTMLNSSRDVIFRGAVPGNMTRLTARHHYFSKTKIKARYACLPAC